MSQYAIVKLGASQHKVSIGDVVVTDRLDKSEGDKFSVSEVYMVADGDKITVGAPTVGVDVEFEVVSHGKGEKIRIHKFKAKSRYHITKGFRAYQTTLKVLGIGGMSKLEKNEKNEELVKTEKIEAKKSEPKADIEKTAKKTITKVKAEK